MKMMRELELQSDYSLNEVKYIKLFYLSFCKADDGFCFLLMNE